MANEGEPNETTTTTPTRRAAARRHRFVAGGATPATVAYRGVRRVRRPGGRAARPGHPHLRARRHRSPGLRAGIHRRRPTGLTAWVTLQENNAVAVVYVASATVQPPGPPVYKDHGIPGNELDASNRDSRLAKPAAPDPQLAGPGHVQAGLDRSHLRRRALPTTFPPTRVTPVPRTASARRSGSRTTHRPDPAVFPDAADCKAEATLGRLNTTTASGETTTTTRTPSSFVRRPLVQHLGPGDGRLVFDSGNDLEVRTAIASASTPSTATTTRTTAVDARSDDKGPEPEGVALGTSGVAPMRSSASSGWAASWSTTSATRGPARSSSPQRSATCR